jgi:putative transcription factor
MNNNKEYQDTTPIVWIKKKKRSEMKSEDGGESVRRHTSNKNQSNINLKKIEDDNENLSYEKVTLSLSQEIQKARVAKKLTQKQLATQINERVDVIQKYENGKAIPDQKILSKLRKILGVRLKK